jgi:hypothetical protein
MESKSPGESRFQTTVSWGGLLLALASLAYVALRIPRERQLLARMFNDFQMKLPAPTQFMLMIPEAAIIAVAVALGLMALALQMSLRVKSNAMAFHLLLVIGCWVALAIYRELMFEAWIALMEGLSR